MDAHDLTDIEAFLLAHGLRPIAGGAPDPGTETADPPETEAGDLTPGEPGDEEPGEEPPEEGVEAPEGEEPPAEGGEGVEEPAVSRSQLRIRELANENRELRQAQEALARRLEAVEPKAKPGGELPAELAEVDKHLGGYMEHKLRPVMELIQGLQSWVQFFGDSADFYAQHPQYAQGKPRQLIETMTRALGAKFGPEAARRVDALRYLRGTTEYAKHFVTEPDPAVRLAGDVTAARRGAGKIAGRQVMKPGAKGGAPDMEAIMAITNPAERSKAIERLAGDTPFS